MWRFNVNFRTIIALPLMTAVVAAFGWVVFWTFFIPQLTGTEVWSGHETLTPVVFLAMWVTGVVSTLNSSLR